MSKIVFLEPLGIPTDSLKGIIDSYLDESCERVYYSQGPKDETELIERSKDADIVVLAQIKFPKAVIDQCSKLKFVCVAFTGTDHVDVAYCHQKGITVSNASGYSTVAVGELVMGLVLNLVRNISECDIATRQGKNKNGLIGYEIEGKTFGIVGLGAIGQRTAALAKAFGCKVIAYNHHPKQMDGVEMVDLDTLLKESDIVSLHVPSNASTKGMIGKQQLEMMKPTALLINCARGPVVDNIALKEALVNKTIAGAGIDVFDGEPPLAADYCLMDAPNCILTPHVGFATTEAFIKRAHIVGDNLKSFEAGSPKNIVK